MPTFFYCITSAASGRSYVGQTTQPARRLTNHLSRRGDYYRDGHSWVLLACALPGGDDDATERLLIKQHDTAWPSGDNRCPGGRAGYPGRTLSERGRAAVTESAKGNKRCSGRVVSEETRAKMRAAKLGRWAPGEHPLCGKKKSPEHVEKMRERMRGAAAWNKGTKATAEMIEANRKSHLGLPAWNKGKAWSAEIKAKISAGRRAKKPPLAP